MGGRDAVQVFLFPPGRIVTGLLDPRVIRYTRLADNHAVKHRAARRKHGPTPLPGGAENVR